MRTLEISHHIKDLMKRVDLLENGGEEETPLERLANLEKRLETVEGICHRFFLSKDVPSIEQAPIPEDAKRPSFLDDEGYVNDPQWKEESIKRRNKRKKESSHG